MAGVLQEEWSTVISIFIFVKGNQKIKPNRHKKYLTLSLFIFS